MRSAMIAILFFVLGAVAGFDAMMIWGPP